MWSFKKRNNKKTQMFYLKGGTWKYVSKIVPNLQYM